MLRICKNARVSLSLLLVALLLLLSACGTSKASGSGSGNASSAASGPVEIVFWNALGGDLGKVLEKFVSDFNASQNEVRVKLEFQGDYYANQKKLLAAVVAGNAPDATMIEIAAVRQFATSGALADMSALMTKHKVDQNDFIEGLLTDAIVNGKLYAVPFNRSTPLLYYNKTLFKQKGLDPNGPKTWDDLRKAAQVLTERNGNQVVRSGIGIPISTWFYEALIAQAGGSVLSPEGKTVTVNSPAGVEALSLWTDMILKDKTQVVPPGAGFDAWQAATTDFVNGKIAMTMESTAALARLTKQTEGKFELGVAFLPKKLDYGVPTGGASLVIMESSKKKEAAFKFVQWMTSTERNAEWSKSTGYMPVRKSTIKALGDFWKTNSNFKVAVDQLNHAKPRPASPKTPEIHDLLTKAMERAVLGQQTPKEALDSVKVEGEKILTN